MIYLPRQLEAELRQRLFGGKALFLYGPRQCGKTTLLRHLTEPFGDEVLWLNGDDLSTRMLLSGITTARWRDLLGKKRILVLDEAQHLEDIGRSLKLVTDDLPEVQLLASGSSSFELMNRTAESLTGRKFEYWLMPFSFAELSSSQGLVAEIASRETRLLYGSYPDVLAHPADAPRHLREVVSSYLFKDIFALDGLRKTSLLEKLVTALALQIGSEVSCNELARLLGTDAHTVERYLDLLEKCFIIFRLRAFSRNLRNEIKKGFKVYFHDLGIRNAILNNFAPLAMRTDQGGLWENYLIAERRKLHLNQPFPPWQYFWRTIGQQGREIDYLEEQNGQLRAWEIKYNPATRAKIPRAFRNAYPTAQTEILTPENYDTFLRESEQIP